MFKLKNTAQKIKFSFFLVFFFLAVVFFSVDGYLSKCELRMLSSLNILDVNKFAENCGFVRIHVNGIVNRRLSILCSEN